MQEKAQVVLHHFASQSSVSEQEGWHCAFTDRDLVLLQCPVDIAAVSVCKLHGLAMLCVCQHAYRESAFSSLDVRSWQCQAVLIVLPVSCEPAILLSIACSPGYH